MVFQTYVNLNDYKCTIKIQITTNKLQIETRKNQIVIFLKKFIICIKYIKYFNMYLITT